MSDDPRIISDVVRELIAAQFPQWRAEPISPVATSGWDNRSFHLGSDKIIRLPSAARYALQPEMEWRWLPHLANHLQMPLPQVLGKGQPSAQYPFCWTVLSFVPGDTLRGQDSANIALANEVATFLNALRRVPATDGPAAGRHNFYRGGDLRIYDQDLRHALGQIGRSVDTETVLKIWAIACQSAWPHAPVWLHGDVAPDNLLAHEGRLAGVIDFGNCGIGDPACDLTIAWTFFEGAASDSFCETIALDKATWARARGWALWKGCLDWAAGRPAAADIVGRLCSTT